MATEQQTHDQRVQSILTGSPENVIAGLKKKSIKVPQWDDLKKSYEVKSHRVFNNSEYSDVVNGEGGTERVSRVGFGLQKLAAKRMAELVYAIPVKRVYKAETPKEKEVAKVIERIYQRNRIDAINIQRANMLFAGCEVFTLWYAIEQPNTYYNLPGSSPCPVKIRCRNYTPIEGDGLFPVFDQYGDMLAMAFSSLRKSGDDEIEYFDVYTATQHLQYINNGGWSAPTVENITLGKIPGVYAWRKEPIWEDTSDTVHEIEMALSRNGNYLRRNAKPILAAFADEEISIDGEAENGEKSEDNNSRDVVQYPKGSDLRYVTWNQSIENLKLFLSETRQLIFTQLQLPDFSFDNMKTTPMSGEARKMMFIDAQLKVVDESGPLLEMHDRELNVIKAFAKTIMPAHAVEIDSLEVETIITPFSITDEKELIENLTTAVGGKAIISRREAIRTLGWSQDIEQTMGQIQEDELSDISEPSF